MIRTALKFLFLIIPLLIFDSVQGQTGGIVTYKKIVEYGLEPIGRPRWDNFIKDLPKTGTFAYTLSFNKEESLFKEDVAQREEAGPMLQRALNGLNSLNPPKEIVLAVYHNLTDQQRLRQVEFMTRDFVVYEATDLPAWKLTTEKKRVLNYICTGAQLETEDGIITAWFTVEIPIPFGPDNFHGLPGLILGIEKGNQMLVLASEVVLNDPISIKKPTKGEYMSQIDFAQTVADKVKEWKATGGRGSGRGRGGN
ncbi:GLPGLI family protein [Roseivirga misakiensis]|uniref:GLPGLI family protein n=1 Tax=Roseivirga misakiensis TaxID=1563681 RepID=A0A1E5SZR4_9BACT|nr:GLPGLI family protein [Roseivirga misakiensis]OEK04599.1 hypothetical protein BFP71_14150 [Roseivirga misakiensis]